MDWTFLTTSVVQTQKNICAQRKIPLTLTPSNEPFQTLMYNMLQHAVNFTKIKQKIP